MIMVSHDRSFLDAVCTDSLHLSGAAKRVTQERGNYSTWFKRRVAKKKAFDQKCKARQMDIAHLKEFIGRGGTYTNVSIQRKMKEEQVAKLLQEEADDQEAMADLQDDIECDLLAWQPPPSCCIVLAGALTRACAACCGSSHHDPLQRQAGRAADQGLGCWVCLPRDGKAAVPARGGLCRERQQARAAG
jgi:hypothetical protein